MYAISVLHQVKSAQCVGERRGFSHPIGEYVDLDLSSGFTAAVQIDTLINDNFVVNKQDRHSKS